MRCVVGGVAAGVALFAWGFVSHMLLPLGEVGIKEIPRVPEVAVTAALGLAIKEGGLYMFPGLHVDGKPTDEQREEHMKR